MSYIFFTEELNATQNEEYIKFREDIKYMNSFKMSRMKLHNTTLINLMAGLYSGHANTVVERDHNAIIILCIYEYLNDTFDPSFYKKSVKRISLAKTVLKKISVLGPELKLISPRIVERLEVQFARINDNFRKLEKELSSMK